MTYDRRSFLVGAAMIGVGLSGCIGTGGPAKITDTQVTYGGDGGVDVLVSLEDTSPNEDKPITVVARVLDGDDVVGEGEKTFNMPADEKANVLVEIDGVEAREGLGAEAEVKS